MSPTKQQFAEWGRQGGKARAAKLSPRRRKQIAKLAVHARESKRNKIDHPFGYNNWREYAMATRRFESASAVAAAIKAGVLPPAKSQSCKDCGAPAVCYDHRDYRFPLRVDPVCKKCDSRRGPGEPYCEPHTPEYRALLKAAKAKYRQTINGR